MQFSINDPNMQKFILGCELSFQSESVSEIYRWMRSSMLNKTERGNVNPFMPSVS